MRKIFVKGRPKVEPLSSGLTEEDISEIAEVAEQGRYAPVMAGVDIAAGADYTSYGMLTPEQSRAFAQRAVDAPSLADIFERAAERRRRQEGTAITLVLGSIHHMRSVEHYTDTVLLEYTKNGASFNCSTVVDSMHIERRSDPEGFVRHVVGELSSLVLDAIREDIERTILAAVMRSPLGGRSVR